MVTFIDGRFVLNNKRKFYNFESVTKYIFEMDEKALNQWKIGLFENYKEILNKQSKTPPIESNEIPKNVQYISWKEFKVLKKIKSNINLIISQSKEYQRFQMIIKKKDYVKYLNLISKLDCYHIEVIFSWKSKPRIYKNTESKNQKMITIYLSTWDCVYMNCDLLYGESLKKSSLIRYDEIYKNTSTYKLFYVGKKTFKYPVEKLDNIDKYYLERREKIIDLLYTKNLDYILSVCTHYDLFIFNNIIESIIPK